MIESEPSIEPKQQEHPLNTSFVEGTFFKDVTEAKFTVEKAKTSLGFTTRESRSNQNERIRYECYQQKQGCCWHLNLYVWKDGRVKIKTVNNMHTCDPMAHLDESLRKKTVSTKFAKELVGSIVARDKKVSPKTLGNVVKTQLKYGNVSAKVMSTVRKQVLQEMSGTPDQCYSRAKAYFERLDEANPGSTVVFETAKTIVQAITDNNNDTVTTIINHASSQSYKRSFVCLYEVAKGFSFCKQIIGLDGTHVIGNYHN